MSGTAAGGAKAAATNKAKYGEDFYKIQGRLGGLKGRTGGFASSAVDKNGLTGKDRAMLYGAKGGRISRRKSKKEVTSEQV